MAITEKNGVFTLQTKNTSYVFKIINDIPVHLYYGEKLDGEDDLTYIVPNIRRSFSVYNINYDKDFSLDNVGLECSIDNQGDFRINSASVKDACGTYVYDFKYDGYNIVKGKVAIPDMPFGRADAKTETLTVVLKSDKAKINLYYSVYPDIDVISTYASVENISDNDIVIDKLCSATADFFGDGYKILTLHGRPAFERVRKIIDVPFGKYVHSSNRGESSGYASPFAIISDKNADENSGRCFGFNLVYSGNFKLETEYGDHKKLRFVLGINDDTFSHTLKSGETFFTPEALRTCSVNGFNGVSINFADYIRDDIMPEKFAKTSRPVVINTWEAFFFDINENKLLDFAVIAKKCGMDTLVIDDGWFSSRRGDYAGLGDWFVAPNIFPSGIKSFVKKVNDLGLNVGIWIEPEMVNPDSELFRAHPDWILGDADVQGRQQLVLDFTNKQVVDYIFESLVNTLSDTGVSYIKWDMNRSLMPFISSYTKNSSEVAHSYMLGVYDLISRLVKAMDGVFFETCSGGGSRFDAGMMYYSAQIWTSDNTCPYERCYIQAGASYAYPVSSMSCHVTITPNGGTQIITTPEFRFGVALNGALGYEYDLFKLEESDYERIKGEIAFYRSVEDIILKGDFYRLITPFDNFKYYSYIIVSKDKRKALFSFNVLNGFCNDELVTVNIFGLDDNLNYKIDGKVLSGKTLRCLGFPIPRISKSGCNFTHILEAIDR